jgi:hypothetical protein
VTEGARPGRRVQGLVKVVPPGRDPTRNFHNALQAGVQDLDRRDETIFMKKAHGHEGK